LTIEIYIYIYIHFTELSDKYAWYAHSYANNFKPFTKVQENVERIDMEIVSPEVFVEKYERPYKPVVIRGLQNNWRASYKWTLEVYFVHYCCLSYSLECQQKLFFLSLSNKTE